MHFRMLPVKESYSTEEVQKEVEEAVLVERNRCRHIVLRTPLDFNWSLPRVRKAIMDAILLDKELLDGDSGE